MLCRLEQEDDEESGVSENQNDADNTASIGDVQPAVSENVVENADDVILESHCFFCNNVYKRSKGRSEVLVFKFQIIILLINTLLDFFFLEMYGFEKLCPF